MADRELRATAGVPQRLKNLQCRDPFLATLKRSLATASVWPFAPPSPGSEGRQERRGPRTRPRGHRDHRPAATGQAANSSSARVAASGLSTAAGTVTGSGVEAAYFGRAVSTVCASSTRPIAAREPSSRENERVMGAPQWVEGDHRQGAPAGAVTVRPGRTWVLKTPSKRSQNGLNTPRKPGDPAVIR